MLTTTEVALRLSITPQTVRNLIKTGKLKAIRIGTDFRVRLEDFHTYIRVSSTHAGQNFDKEITKETERIK